MPCFEYYAHDRHPLNDVFQARQSFVNHVKGFLSGILECESLIDMKDRLTGKEIKAIRGDSDESRRVIRLMKYPQQLYRVDYCDNALRLYFGFNSQYRIVDVVAIDVDHTYFN
jgi:hypothetical protein